MQILHFFSCSDKNERSQHLSSQQSNQKPSFWSSVKKTTNERGSRIARIVPHVGAVGLSHPLSNRVAREIYSEPKVQELIRVSLKHCATVSDFKERQDALTVVISTYFLKWLALIIEQYHISNGHEEGELGYTRLKGDFIGRLNALKELRLLPSFVNEHQPMYYMVLMRAAVGKWAHDRGKNKSEVIALLDKLPSHEQRAFVEGFAFSVIYPLPEEYLERLIGPVQTFIHKLGITPENLHAYYSETMAYEIRVLQELRLMPSGDESERQDGPCSSYLEDKIKQTESILERLRESADSEGAATFFA